MKGGAEYEKSIVIGKQFVTLRRLLCHPYSARAVTDNVCVPYGASLSRAAPLCQSTASAQTGDASATAARV